MLAEPAMQRLRHAAAQPREFQTPSKAIVNAGPRKACPGFAATVEPIAQGWIGCRGWCSQAAQWRKRGLRRGLRCRLEKLRSDTTIAPCPSWRGSGGRLLMAGRPRTEELRLVRPG